MTAPEQDAVAKLREIVRLAGEVALAGGPGDELGLRNRATEIAAIAETLVWTLDPDAADWNLELYDATRRPPGTEPGTA
jgi:hypothetical protein